jgi:hypothetical protein
MEVDWCFCAFGGFAVVAIALIGWLSKIWAERILEKDREHYREDLERLKSTYEGVNKSLQAELDQRLHVHTVQFETEFRALSEIWANIAHLRSDMASIRPMYDRIAPDPNDPMAHYRTRLLKLQ